MKPDTNGRQIKFIRVGVDTGWGGRLSRLFPHGYYHFIPIPYHNDPEFCGWTYGDASGRKMSPKYRSLANLRSGDVLVLYAGFEIEGTRKKVVGIFAYLVVDKCIVTRMAQGGKIRYCVLTNDERGHPERVGKKWLQKGLATEARYNQHVHNHDVRNHYVRNRNVRNQPLNDPCAFPYEVIVVGNVNESRLLRRVEVLASLKKGRYTLPAVKATTWGLRKGTDLKRSSVRTVKGDTDFVFKCLKEAARKR